MARRKRVGRPITRLPSLDLDKLSDDDSKNKRISFNKTTKIFSFGEQLYNDLKKIYDIKKPSDLIELRKWVEKNRYELGLSTFISNYENNKISSEYKDRCGKIRTILFNYDLNRIRNMEIKCDPMSDGFINTVGYDDSLDSRLYNSTDMEIDQKFFDKSN